MLVWLIRRFSKVLFHVKLRHRLPKLPRGFATDYNRRVDDDVALAFKHVAVRSPAGLKLAMKRTKSSTVDELIAKLPVPKKVDPADRFVRWARRLENSSATDPVVSPYVRELLQTKRITRKQKVIRRSSYRPYKV